MLFIVTTKWSLYMQLRQQFANSITYNPSTPQYATTSNWQLMLSTYMQEVTDSYQISLASHYSDKLVQFIQNMVISCSCSKLGGYYRQAFNLVNVVQCRFLSTSYCTYAVQMYISLDRICTGMFSTRVWQTLSESCS